MYSKAQILQTRIKRIHAYSEVILIPWQKPFKMIRKNEGYNEHFYSEFMAIANKFWCPHE